MFEKAYDIVVTYPEVAGKLKDELYGVIIPILVGCFEFEIDYFRDFKSGELIRENAENKTEMLRMPRGMEGRINTFCLSH